MAIISEDILNELKHNNYEFIEVIGVEVDGNSSCIICKCECGNIFKKKLHQMKNLSVHCGCKKSFLLSRGVRNKISNDPTFLKRRGESYSKWCKDHQEEVAAQGKRHSEKLLSNPEKLAEQGKRHSQWYKDNPDKVKEKAKKSSQWYKDNPDKVKERSIKYSQWCKDNPDKVKEKSNKYSKWRAENPLSNVKRGDTISSVKFKSRVSQILEFAQTELLKIHPDDLCAIINGEIKSDSLVRIKCPNCGNYEYHRFDLSFYLKGKVVIQRLCGRCYYLGKSKYEDELYNYITSIGCTCIRHDRTVLDGKELDLYIPDKKVAIEFNGSYWHCELNKGKFYHYDKFIKCLEKGVRLISIYEYDYLNAEKRCKLLDLIKMAVSSCNNHIFARKCSVREISRENAKAFFSKYHLDGFSKQCTICYGLYNKDNLVSAMAFGRLRCQNKLRNKEGHYELVRYAAIPDTIVVGGMSKLFNHFIKYNNPKYILSYSDNDCFDGHSYTSLGFSLVSRGRNSIDYNWVKKEDVLYRQQCMPCKLLKKFPIYRDTAINGSVEKFIMEDLGYYRVYRCSNSKWEFIPQMEAIKHDDVSEHESSDSIANYIPEIEEDVYDYMQ